MFARSLLIQAGLFASAAAAAPTIDPPFGNHAVIQRDRPILFRGDAAPNEHLTVSFAGVQKSANADANGRWQAVFLAHGPGGPFAITVSGSSGEARADDISIGDVWLCSGQSNMEYPLRRSLNGDGEVQSAADADLRLMKVPHQLAPTPNQHFDEVPSWQPATPQSATDFSAACYFLVRELRATEKVPVGAIDDSWGGTPIRAWMDEAAVRASGGEKAADVVDLYRSNPTAAVRQFGGEWGAWWRSQTGDKVGAEPWNASRRLTWKPVPSLTYWDSWGPDWKAWIGAAWLLEHVTLTPTEAAQSATLSLSAVDDMDQTFVNGIAVGGKNDPSNPRSYPLPKATLKSGPNEILVYARNVWGRGGPAGPAENFKLTFADGHSKPLASGWEYSRIAGLVGEPPVSPWDGSSGVSTIYNAMVAPLGPLAIKGVAWYQGEADVGQAGYDKRLAAWMGNWRSQFHDPQLPFLIVGLAGWGKPVSHPAESGWAATINEQRLGVERDSHAALASAIDLGEPDDIHPANKQEVGRRLALAAHQLVYRDGGTVGPLPVSAVRHGNDIVVSFTKPLQALNGSFANAFELCGASVGTCRYADARVEGNTVEIATDGEATRVRYAWADYPVVNLYDQDMLPAPVFEIPVQ
ncbi:MAG TPA: sialate O-acetylesterase [Sphingomicrobium sp.]|nr:sialate O-acetylesterase [Sphingomicrobium sp.]